MKRSAWQLLNRLIFTGLLLFYASDSFAQKMLLVENVHSLKNFKYYEGNGLILQLSGNRCRIADNIVDLTDSTVIFVGLGEVKMSNISCIYRENWLIRILREMSLIGGAAFLGIDSFNRLINHEYPVIQTETLLISGGMVAFSFALIPFKYRKIDVSKKWQMRLIDQGSL